MFWDLSAKNIDTCGLDLFARKLLHHAHGGGPAGQLSMETRIYSGAAARTGRAGRGVGGGLVLGAVGLARGLNV